MKRILITGADSYIGTSFEKYVSSFQNDYSVDTVDMIDGSWKDSSFSGYDVVFHVAGIAHSDISKVNDALDLVEQHGEKLFLEGVLVNKRREVVSVRPLYGLVDGIDPLHCQFERLATADDAHGRR